MVVVGAPKVARPVGPSSPPLQSGESRAGVYLWCVFVVPPAADDAATLEIFPPFRLELAAGPARKMLVEAGSDADFRAVNARTAEAQAAPKNRYAQQYLDVSGQPGDLRVERRRDAQRATRVADGERRRPARDAGVGAAAEALRHVRV